MFFYFLRKSSPQFNRRRCDGFGIVIKVKYIYFIAETKGSMSSLQLKKVENAKINCAKRLFESLNNGTVHYGVADTYQHLMDIMNK